MHADSHQFLQPWIFAVCFFALLTRHRDPDQESGASVSEHRQCSRPPQRNLLLESTLVHLATGSASLQYAGRSTRRTYVEFAGVEVVASLVAHVGCDAPAGGIVNAAVDCRRLTLIDALKETWNSSERASLSDPERGHLLCPDLQSAQCRRLNIPPALPPPTHLAAEEAELGHTQKSEHVALFYSGSSFPSFFRLISPRKEHGWKVKNTRCRVNRHAIGYNLLVLTARLGIITNRCFMFLSAHISALSAHTRTKYTPDSKSKLLLHCIHTAPEAPASENANALEWSCTSL